MRRTLITNARRRLVLSGPSYSLADESRRFDERSLNKIKERRRVSRVARERAEITDASVQPVGLTRASLCKLRQPTGNDDD